MVVINPSHLRRLTQPNVILVVLLNTLVRACSSEISHAPNLTKLLSDFVLTCGSSETFCNKSQSPLQIEPTIIPECAQWLKCDPNCALEYICAPDAMFAYIDVSCIGTSIYPLKVEHSSYSYNMITQCGLFSSNNTGRKPEDDALCTELPERTINNLHDDVFRPVIARGSLITYRNIHCARCNDEDDDDIVPFELYVECYDDFDINSFNTLQDAWNSIYENNCSVDYIRPYEFLYDVHSCPLQENMISHCNTTGLWGIEEYDPQIEWACEHFKSLTYKEHYRNIYCYMCNPSLVSKYNTELISSCNTINETDFIDETIVSGCTAHPVMYRMSPFKNVFCQECNGVQASYIHVERKFDDLNFNATIYNSYYYNPLNAGKRAYTEFRALRFEPIESVEEIAKVNAGDGNFADLIDALNELGKLCGYEDMCSQPFKPHYSYLGITMCNFPCIEDSDCCSMLLSGIDPGTAIATNLSLPVADLKTIYNQTTIFNRQSNSTRTLYSHLPLIGTCKSGYVRRYNMSRSFQAKCEQQSHGDILEYIPVTSIATRLDYRNVYCARCNGELGIVDAYMFTAECGTIIGAETAASFADINEIIRKENCEIKIEMPYNECRNDPDCVQKCLTNETNSNLLNHIRYLCERAELMNAMFGYIKFNDTLYKNVFCFLCNVQWNVSESEDAINQCNQTRLWDYIGNTTMREMQCEKSSFHPAWYQLGYKNIFCAACNMQEFWFYQLFSGGGGISCEGLGCIFQESAYRSAFSLSVSPPGKYAGSEDTERDSAEFCAAGKTMVGETCQPVLENTVNLRYDLKFELDIVELLEIDKNISMMTLLESVRQQITSLISYRIPDGVYFTSVVVSGFGPCVDKLTGEKITVQEKMNTTNDVYPMMLLEADIVVEYTGNRSRLENDLINLRQNWTFIVIVDTGFVTFISYPHFMTSECLQFGMGRANKGCTISEFDSKNDILSSFRKLSVNELLTCILLKLPGDDIILLEELCSKGIPFYFDTDKESLVICKSDALRLNYTRVITKQSVPHSVTKLSVVHAIFSFVCTCFSLLCLTITFMTYCLFKCIRTLPGINNMNLTLTLFGAQIFTQFGIWLTEHEGRCIILGVITHYFWLCTFCAMNICSFHMFKVFTSLMYTSQNQSKWVVVNYCLYVYVMPVFVILSYFVVKVSVDGSQHLGYGGSVCFLSELIPIVAVLISPAVVIIIANFIFSILAYRRIRCSPHVQSNLDRNDFKIYVKLLTVTGVAWPLIFIDSVLPLTAFSFIATFANALQGVFIFFAFICNKKVLGLYKKLCGLGHPYSIAIERQKKSTSDTAM